MTPSPDAPAFRTYGEVEILRGRFAALQTEVERLQAVVKAARIYAIWHVCERKGSCGIRDDFNASLAALDASPTPEQAGQWRCRCGELHPADLGCSHYPAPRDPGRER